METTLPADPVPALRNATTPNGLESLLARTVQAKHVWSSQSIKERLKTFRQFRQDVAQNSSLFAEAMSADLHRTPADTQVAEIIPLLAACKFLENQADAILAVKPLGRRGLPFWLSGIDTEVHRVALGLVLVIGPSNYPLFIPGVQVLQAVIAGNAVIWKPGRGGYAVAKVFQSAMLRAGLPDGVLRVTEDTVEATSLALNELPDKVFFTGSVDVGRILMRRLAETLTPSVMELSGCDAVIVLPSSDRSRVMQALTFGMRFNGSETCMAPRRILLVDATAGYRKAFLSELQRCLSQVPAIRVRPEISRQVHALLHEAETEGAQVYGAEQMTEIRPIVVTSVRPDMRLAQTDIFAPILSIIEVVGDSGILAAQEACPFALTAAIFGDEKDARRLAPKLVAGCILINDIIVPTADPRLAFGGRRQSGFGITRGVEGLLEMTAVKTIVARRGKSQRHYEATTASHVSLFEGLIAASHSRSLVKRLKGLKQMAVAGKVLSSRKRIEEKHGQ